MFWNKKNKLPITQEDRVWVEMNLSWFKSQINKKRHMQIKTVTPTKDFYDRDFDGTEKDADFILERNMKLIGLKTSKITLQYFSDTNVRMSDGTILSTPADINGKWSSASGTYQKTKHGAIISIEREQLKDTDSLIATLAHELSHQFLLGERRYGTDDEYTTDLVAVFYGFGIFLGNTHFQFKSEGFGWKSTKKGYLPEQIIAYTMAKLSYERKEATDYSVYLKKSVKKYFDQSMEWIIENEKK
ncbi:hypothetical protein [Tenacibaculum sp. M341]|uniref:hypothetical protein n=1 Tax=Tenacibaculum sp. M341 TaxID=2530339 RepID=UPI0010453C81|nr:hypothetical protein [Tenacibaculum sp. M341]TCI90591.1 hypothetical protein EYW44_12755 [Tenacibaculum sp. M341]